MKRNTYTIALLLGAMLLAWLPANSQTISGNVHTETGQGMTDATVTLTGPGGLLLNDLTDANGDFSFTGLTDNEVYTLCVENLTNSLNGVTSADLVHLQNHVLLIQPLGSPYKILAGDTDATNQAPDVTDLLRIRQLILGILTDLPAPSWRFVPSNLVFSDLDNPFASYVPPGCRTVALSGNAPAQDFVAVKTADFNGSAIPNFISSDKN